MKTILLFTMILSASLLYGQVTLFTPNKSRGIVATSITSPTSIPQEAFRFAPGIVRQLDSGADFTFNSSRWFSIGSLNTGNQDVYGLRFQLPNKSLTMGYQDINDTNPRIQWIGSGASLGDLEFRVATSFTSTNSRLVATMTRDGNTIFGDPAAFSTNNPSKVAIQNTGSAGLRISSGGSSIGPINSSVGLSISQSTGTSSSTGIQISTSGGNNSTGIVMKTGGTQRSIGIQSFAVGSNTTTEAIGIRGTTVGQAGFRAGIFGEAPSGTLSSFAGFFDGDVFVTGILNPSDRKLKDNISDEVGALERLSQLRPVTYNYKKIDEMNLPTQEQHGFISQEMEKVFPELTKDITKPVFDEEGKITSEFSVKTINYNGLISVLTAAVNELNVEVELLREELADLKEDRSLEKNNSDSQLDNSLDSKFKLEQNVPNPFNDRTSIRYKLEEGVTNASLMIFDMSGKIIKEIKISNNSGEININASQIGKGMFIYSLVQGGQELMSKKMIIK